MARLLDINGRKPQPEEFEIAVELGQVDGWRFLSAWNENSAVNTVQEEMSNVSGIRTLPTAASEITIASTTANDAAAGTGARTVKINYLDDNFAEKSVTMTLNGTTNVVTSGVSAYRFVSAFVMTAGSGGDADGNITITIDGNAQARILAGQNESRESGFTVPANKVFLPTNALISSGRAGTAEVDFAFEYRDPDTGLWYTLRSLEVYQSVADLVNIGVTTFPAQTDFRVLAVASTGAPTAFVQWRGYVINV